ncbi:unnamed protein product [Eruca vesicaria subsp. sativa]|uniref:GRF-type domain-containing protein n=1 Tax=Eruca vesicaria subsp. sativa TaxID=29727 RepID=A0ABC8KH60_ERUVS|nr:unnamed protein product [Eruca vesicaria subsp. sativa]
MGMELGPGILRRCPCGELAVVLTSKTKKNPGRRLYRCGELGALSIKHSVMANELIEIKEQLEDMKKHITEIVEVVAALSKKIRK